MMGDFLLQQSGHQPMYLNMLKFRQDADAQRVDNDYRRAATDELRRKATAPQIEKVGDSIVSVGADGEIGRASCRERVCQYVEILVGAVTLKKTQKKKII